MSETSNTPATATSPSLRHDWSKQEITELFDQPFNDLIFQAQSIHRQNFEPNQVQVSTLLSIKTGGCPEDCGYCPQSVHHEAPVQAEKLMDVDAVVDAAKAAKEAGIGFEQLVEQILLDAGLDK